MFDIDTKIVLNVVSVPITCVHVSIVVKRIFFISSMWEILFLFTIQLRQWDIEEFSMVSILKVSDNFNSNQSFTFWFPTKN